MHKASKRKFRGRADFAIKSMLKNNFWHTKNGNDTVFVFIHGFFSDSTSCWTSYNGAYWPDLVSTDMRLGNPSIYMAGYYTDVDSGAYSVADCAREVVDGLTRPGVDGTAAPLSKFNLVFVAHSLGGIVLRYMLEHNRELFSDKNVALILIASPSFGSDYATSLRSLAYFYKNRLATQLKRANASLVDLDDRFKALLDKKLIPSLVGAEAIEHHFLFKLKWLPGFQPIVPKESAARYFGASRTLAGTDHSSCVKPSSLDHVAHQFLIDTYLKKVSTIIKTSVSHISQSGQKKIPGCEDMDGVLFDIYHATLERHYLAREIDSILVRTLSLFSVWTYGVSGSGKTSAVRREVFRQAPRALQAYIGAAVSLKGTHTDLLLEVYYSVTMKLGVASKNLTETRHIVAELANLFSSNLESRVFLVLDEVPVLESADEMHMFVAAICRIVALTKQEASRPDLRLIVTSIFDPADYLPTDSNKIAEQISFLRFEPWTVSEIRQLAEQVEVVIPDISLQPADLAIAIMEADGCPRFIKTLYRRLRLEGVVNSTSFKLALDEARSRRAPRALIGARI